ncbi:MAG: hypothetical protein VX589_09995 [Myxococcota bacterium]|nr:hypothetical protein [Myxococcota bacterium]
MFPRSERRPADEKLTPLAESIADVLMELGDVSGASHILKIVSHHRLSDGIALRTAENALKQGDASTALDALIPAWEAGSPDLHLEVQMGLASLALGIYDVVETLTADEDLSVDHLVLRLFVCLWDGLEVPQLDFQDPEVVWIVNGQLQTLARCGREDIVHLVADFAARQGYERLTQAIRSLPQREPSSGRPHAPPLNGRAAFVDAWSGLAPDAAFSWAWSSARQALEGERVLLVAPSPEAVRPLLGPTCVTSHALVSREDGQQNEHGSYTGTTQFEQVIVFFEPNYSTDLSVLIQRYERRLCHGGQLHLMLAGPALAGEFNAVFNRRAVEVALDQAGLELLGSDARDHVGMPVADRCADVHVFRAEKRIV